MKHFFILSLALLAVTVTSWFLERHVVLAGRVYPRDATVLVLREDFPAEALLQFQNLSFLDLRGRGLTIEEYEKIRRKAGQARLVWELDFQGRRVDADSRCVEIDQLTDADMEKLALLPRLQSIRAENCRDYSRLLRLAGAHPDWDIRCRVPLGDGYLDSDDTAPAPGNCTEAELRLALSLLPRIRCMDLRQTGLSPTQARALASDHPRVRFLWEEELGGKRFLTNAREIDLSGAEIPDTASIEALLPYLPQVEKIILCDCGLSSPELAALGERHPEIRFVWRVRLGPLSARTDDKWFAPITKRQLIGGHDVDELKYCTDMECIDLGHCWITDCEWARGMRNLRYLVLADTNVRDISPLAGLKKLQFLELFVTPVRDYSPLLGCTGLEDLNLGYTYGDPTPIASMTWLKNLWWGGIHYVPWVNGKNPADLLQRGLPDTKIMLYAGSSTGLGWRNLPHYYEMRDRIGMPYMTG